VTISGRAAEPRPHAETQPAEKFRNSRDAQAIARERLRALAKN